MPSVWNVTEYGLERVKHICLSRIWCRFWTDIRFGRISPDFRGIYGQTYANRTSLQISAGYMDIPTQTEHLSRFQGDLWTYLRKPSISPDFRRIYGQTYVNRTSLQISGGYMDRPTQTEHHSRLPWDLWTDICKASVSPDFTGIYGEGDGNISLSREMSSFSTRRRSWFEALYW